MDAFDERARLYRVLVYPDPDGVGGYVAEAPEFPGVCAGGDTPEAALSCAYDGIATMIEDLLADGEPLPAPAVVLAAK